MQYLRTNTAARVTVGPFFDETDGVTPRTSLTVTNCKLTLVVDDANVPTLVLDTNPTASGGSNDMVHITGDDAGFYDLELAAANVNYLGRAKLAVTDAANHCPVFQEFMILPAVVYDAMILGTDLFDVSLTQVNGAAQTATLDTIKADSAAILVDSNELQTDWTNGGRLDLLIDAIKAVTDVLVSPATIATAVWAAGTRLLTAGTNIVLAKGTGVAGFNDLSAAQVNAEADTALTDYDGPTHAEMTAELATADDAVLAQVALVKAKTDNLPSDPADASVVAGRFDTLDTSVADVEGKVDDLESRLGTPSDLGSGATIAANLVDVEAQTDDIGVAGAGLTALAAAAELAKVPKSDSNVTWNATAAAQLQSEAADALTAYDPPTGAEVVALFGLMGALLGDIPTNAELTSALDAVPTAAENAAALLATAYEDSETVQDFLRLVRAATVGLASGAETTEITYFGADETTPRIVATVDSPGNRTALTADPS